jgi:hypothetical protein
MRIATRVVAIAALLLLSSCATQPHASEIGAPNFWFGLLHGVISPVTLVISFFDPVVRIYAFPNSGWWYDLGYFLGVAFVLGGGSRSV